jgi:hypothetical protein
MWFHGHKLPTENPKHRLIQARKMNISGARAIRICQVLSRNNIKHKAEQMVTACMPTTKLGQQQRAPIGSGWAEMARHLC